MVQTYLVVYSNKKKSISEVPLVVQIGEQWLWFGDQPTETKQ
tara:strand:+ start:1165 stop:1290 length:126 start_codon:yes stop_codon:yes gene_type:complete